MEENDLHFSRTDIGNKERNVKLDNARLLMRVTGLILIMGFSIFTFMGPSPSSPKSGTKIQPVKKLTLITPTQKLNSKNEQTTLPSRALINEPKILFLDEPTLGLDPKGQQDIQKMLLDLNRDKGVTIFLSSHDLSDVSYMCNRMAIINHRMLIAQGNVQELSKLVGGSMGMVITVLNSTDAETKLSKMGYKFEINADEGGNLIDVFIFEGIQDSVNKILDTFDKVGLQLYEVRRLDTSLEEIFFKLTQSSERLNFRGVLLGVNII